ncbi:hypothetical protein JKF63_07599 [Porcisia hertigi]|uniref:Uncharacterized protein n=1 Tax=Porcisia hertigi TaxID=2761500 RepID=A0A836YH10_9TRYP|nr:hypothetical protein JKF63_07599 [Porcisia hertigi]
MSAPEGDRQAFLRLIGLTDTDMFDPAHQSAAMPNAQASLKGNPTGRAQRGVKQNSSLMSSMGGLSHSASLGGDTTQSSLMATTNTPRGTSPISGSGPPSSSRLFSTPRSVHWLDESSRATSHVSKPPHQEGALRTTVAALSDELKENGNRAFEAGAFREAVEQYTAAIDALSSSSSHSGVEVLLLAALHSNRSAACLQAAHQMPSAEDAYTRALWDADRAVALRPSWFKGYARQGDAYLKLKRYGTAAEAYEMAVQLDPQNHTLVNALAEARQRAKKAAREDLELRRTTRSTASAMSSAASTMTDHTASSTLCKEYVCGVSAPPQEKALRYTHEDSRHRSGQTQQMWARLKNEVEATVHEPTGDAYRLQQLERFRARSSNDVTPTAQKSAMKRPFARDAASASASAPTSAMKQGRDFSGHHHSPAFKTDVDANTTAAAEEKSSLSPVSNFSTGALPSASQPRPRRHSSSPATGGITEAMSAFDGPVQNVRDVPYEFSSAAASAYQQRLLEAFRKRKSAQ